MEDLGGYSTTYFVKKPTDNLICGVCLEVLKNPHQCKNGHMACLSCITTALDSNQECPTCKTYLSIKKLSRSLAIGQIIDDLEIKCSSDKCDWTGKLGEQSTHSESCEFQDVDCPLYECNSCSEDCTGKIARGELKHHKKTRIANNHEDTVEKLLLKIKELKDDVKTFKDALPTAAFVEFKKGNQIEVLVGAIKYTDGAVFIGDFVNGNVHGNATLFEDKDVYRGKCVEGHRQCHGKEVYGDGSTYDGQWVMNKRHGFGTLTRPDIYTYTGQWVDHEFSGPGVITYFKNNAKFEGNFVEGKKHGPFIVTLGQPGPDLITFHREYNMDQRV
jgi:hypothetical protein